MKFLYFFASVVRIHLVDAKHRKRQIKGRIEAEGSRKELECSVYKSPLTIFSAKPISASA